MKLYKRSARTRTKRKLGLLPALLAIVLIAASCGSSTDPTDTSDGANKADGPTITIGAQDFGESAILAQVYGQALSNAGYPVEQQALGGFRDLVYTAFESDEINFTAEYLSSSLEFLNSQAEQASPDTEETHKLYVEALKEKKLVALEPAPGQNANVLVVLGDSEYKKVSDLTPELRLGGPPDCEENSGCIPLLKRVYDLDLSENFSPLDGGGPLTVSSLEGGEVDVAVFFSTDGVLASKDWTVLEDDKNSVNAENITPVVSEEVSESYGKEMSDLVNEISKKLTTEELSAMNSKFVVDKEDAEKIAETWLKENGFLK